MKRKFFGNLLFLVLLNLIIKPFWFFGIEVTVQNRVSNAEYGIYFSLLSFATIFNILLDLGITNFNNREIARNNILLSKYFSNIIGLKFLLGIVYTVFCVIVGFFIGYDTKHFILLGLIILNQFLLSFILYLRSNLNGLFMFVTDSILSVLDKSLMIIFCSLLLWTSIFGNQFVIEWFIYAQTLSYVITASIAFYIVLKKSHFFSIRFDKAYFIHIIKLSLPFSILVLLMQMYNRFEPVLIERLLPDGEVQSGMYAQVYRIMDAFSNFSLLFAILLLPIFSKMLKHNENVGNVLKLAGTLLLVPALCLVVSCVTYKEEIIGFFYHSTDSASIFGIVIVGFIGVSTTYIFGTLLTANGNLKQLNIMALTAVIVNISLNLILIPLLKSKGAAISSMTTQTLTAIIQVILACRILKLKINYKLFFSYIAICGILIVVALTIKHYPINWFVGLLIISLSGGISAIFFRLLNIRELRLLFLPKDKETI
jgi:O-antigen/teichoic acid export membrane protein